MEVWRSSFWKWWRLPPLQSTAPLIFKVSGRRGHSGASTNLLSAVACCLLPQAGGSVAASSRSANCSRHYLACSTAGVMSVTWIALLASSTVPKTLTIFPRNFLAVVLVIRS